MADDTAAAAATIKFSVDGTAGMCGDDGRPDKQEQDDESGSNLVMRRVVVVNKDNATTPGKKRFSTSQQYGTEKHSALDMLENPKNVANNEEADKEEEEDDHDEEDDDEDDDDKDDDKDDMENHEDDANANENEEDDNDEFRVNCDGIPLVNGRQMKRGVPLTNRASLLDDPVLKSHVQRLATGPAGFDLDQFVKDVVAETTGEFQPSTRMFGVVLLWNNKKKKQHFFLDSYFSQKVLCEEIGGITFVTYLSLRGWSVTRKKDGEIDITYRRLHECVKDLILPPGVVKKYFQLIAMLERVRNYLLSPSAFSPEQAPSPPERQPEDEIKDAVVRETTFKVQKVPAFDNQLNLIDINGANRNLREHQHLQLAISAIRVCFVPVMSKSVRNNQQYIEKMFGLVFKGCASRRQFLEGIQDLLMYCKDQQTIQDNKSTLRSWLKTPTNILTLAHQSNNATAVEQGYGSFLWSSVQDKFKRSSIGHHGRSMERDRVVVQVVVYMYLKALDGRTTGGVSFGSLTTRQVLLLGSRKRKNHVLEEGDDSRTTTIDSTSNPSPQTAQVIPVHTVAQLTSIPSLLAQSGGAQRAQEEEEQVDTTSSLPSHTIPYDAVSRWTSKITLATVTQMRGVTARLVIESPDCDIWLYHSPIELYVGWELHNMYHQFLVKPKEDQQEQREGPASSLNLLRTTVIVPDGGNLHVVKPYLVVARPGYETFDEYFTHEFFKIDLAALAQFIFKHGTSDPGRSTIGFDLPIPVLGSRFDFGNSGQAMEQGTDFYRPKTLCNTSPLLAEDEKGDALRVILGRIVDAVCNCSQYLSENVVGRAAVMNQRRFEEFGLHLRNFLFAQDSVTEWITLQILNLSHHQGGVRHKDVCNDPREGYNRTMCFCLHFTDGVGDLWSLKVITGYRKRIGDYMGGPWSKLLPLKSSLLHHTTRIDAGYKDILRRYKSTYVPFMIPSWEDPSLFWLDDHMPYEVRFLKGGIQLESFSMITGTTLSYWLSPALTGAYLLAQFTSVRGMVQLAAIAVCQNSFEHYFLVTQEMLKNQSRQLCSLEDKYPILTYCDTCVRLFAHHGLAESGIEFVGGEYSPPRYSPITFNFRTMFGSDRQKVDLLVDELMSLIDSVNEIEENGLLLAPCRSLLDPLLKSTSDHIAEFLPDCAFGPFRLLLFLQFCAHLKIGLTECKNLRNLLYPLSGAVSHRRILDHGFNESQVDEICSFLQSEISTPARVVFIDEIEPMLCEAFPSEKHWEGNDIFIKGQYLFRLDEHGTPWVKEYGKRLMWSRVPQKKDQ